MVKREIPSSSAEIDALIRAIEFLKPEGDRVCSDRYARNFLSDKYSLAISDISSLRTISQDIERKNPGATGCIIGRTRYIDEYFKTCIDAGIEQLVILGAGYDSRAYRFELGRNIKVFELDQSATQLMKKERVIRTLGKLPENVIYVPVDFERDKLREKMFENDYNQGLKTLFICEGVTMYITVNALDKIMKFAVENSGKGTSIIFNYKRKPVQNDDYLLERDSIYKVDGRAESSDFTAYDGDIERFLSGRGLIQVRNVDGDYFKGTYFKGINQDRNVCCSCEFVTALVRS